MPKTDTDPLGDGFKWRLRAELNRISPRYSSPRYLSPARHRMNVWRVAPAGLAAAIVGMLGLTAFAATGSPNPAVWTQQIVTRVEPSAAPESSPTSSASSAPSPHSSAPAPAPPAQRSDNPTPRSQPSEQPEATPSPEHDDGEPHPAGTPRPSASPDDR